MKFAYVNGERVEPSKGAKGVCSTCGSEVIARCGEIRIHHWAHKGSRHCDAWWENEKDWHREWKNQFPFEWQEIIHSDQKGERHIADVKTEHGLVVEFQHSHIDWKEQTERERFYGNMIWVVDGTRLKRDLARFLKGKARFRQTRDQGMFEFDYSEEVFPMKWLNSTKHVIFDFNVNRSADNHQQSFNFLVCLFPKTSIRERYVAYLTKESFIMNIKSGKWFSQQKTEPAKTEQAITVNRPTPKRSSGYVLHKGRMVKRRRW